MMSDIDTSLDIDAAITKSHQSVSHQMNYMKSASVLSSVFLPFFFRDPAFMRFIKQLPFTLPFLFRFSSGTQCF
jgi:hypothetical protein